MKALLSRLGRGGFGRGGFRSTGGGLGRCHLAGRDALAAGEARNLLLISGAVPGAEGGQVLVRPSVKAARKSRRQATAPSKSAAAKPGAKPAAAKPEAKPAKK